MPMWMKQTLIWFNLQRDGTGNGYFCRTFAATNISSASNQSKSLRLVSQVHMMAGQNVKKK